MSGRSPILVVKSSRIKFAFLILVAAGFVILGVFILVKGKSTDAWIGWSSIAFFGLGIPLFAKQLFDARPRVILDEAGVFDRTLGVGIIPWSEISGAYLKVIHGNAFICLVLKDSSRWTQNLSSTQRALVSAYEKLGFQPLNINLSGTAVDAELVLDVVLKKSGAAAH